VDDELGSVKRALESGTIGHVGLRELSAGGANPRRGAAVDVDPRDGRALRREGAADGATDEPAGARDGRAAALEAARFGHGRDLILARS
jgi:hypothetical protein